MNMKRKTGIFLSAILLSLTVFTLSCEDRKDRPSGHYRVSDLSQLYENVKADPLDSENAFSGENASSAGARSQMSCLRPAFSSYAGK